MRGGGFPAKVRRRLHRQTYDLEVDDMEAAIVGDVP
jgi:hypothetical protein